MAYICGNLRDFLVVQPDDHPLDQYLRLRNETLTLVESKDFLDALQRDWQAPRKMNPLAACTTFALGTWPSSRPHKIALRDFRNP